MPPRARSASKQRSSGPRPIFAGVDRQAPRAQQSRSLDGTLSLIGEQCRLFEDGSGLAAELEAGQHLLPCFGDEGVTVDRFDARLLLPAAPAAAGSRAGGPELNREEEAELDAERYRDLRRQGSESSDSDADDAHPRPGVMAVRIRAKAVDECPHRTAAHHSADDLAAGGAAIPHNYGSSDTASAASFQQVGYGYGAQQPEQHERSQSAAAETSTAAAAAEQGEPFAAPFPIPQSLQTNLPATMQQHKVHTALVCGVQHPYTSCF
jgi:Alternative splicing regulator